MGLSRSRVGIVGGTGRMGSWLAGLLEEQGYTVVKSGRRTGLSPAEMTRDCDVVVVSVPIAETVRVIRELGPLVPRDGLLMDLSSLKKGPVEAMLKYSRGEVVGAHPLFGPGHANATGLRIALCPGRGEEGLKWAADLFGRAGYEVTTLDAGEHDRMMGLIQGVNHFSALALALCISRSGIALEDLMDNSTQTFQERVERIRAILVQPAELFGSLLTDNPAAGDFVEQYLDSVEGLIRITREGDRRAFRKFFESLRPYFLQPAAS